MQNFLFLFIFSLILIACPDSNLRFTTNPSQLQIQPSTHESLYDVKEEAILRKPANTQVDILIVVDASKSMYHHLTKLGKSLEQLLSVIHEFEWQIAFIGVDHGDHFNEKRPYQAKWQDYPIGKRSKKQAAFGQLIRLDGGRGILDQQILTKDLRNYTEIFYHTLSHKHPEKPTCSLPPHCSPYLEQPLRSLKSAIERSSLDNKNFFRPEADLITLVITNEDERGTDQERATSAQEVVSTFHRTFQGLNKQFIGFGILVKDEECKKQELKNPDIKSEIGKRVADLAKITGGENIDICSKDYGPHLKKISNHIRAHVAHSLVLSRKPIPGTIHIEFQNSKNLPWVSLGKKLVFKGKIDRDIPLTIQYKITK